MAPTGGFEPPRRFHDLSVFKTDPFNRLGMWANMADVLGVEPSPTVFQTVASTELAWRP